MDRKTCNLALKRILELKPASSKGRKLAKNGCGGSPVACRLDPSEQKAGRASKERSRTGRIGGRR